MELVSIGEFVEILKARSLPPMEGRAGAAFSSITATSARTATAPSSGVTPCHRRRPPSSPACTGS
jgi:hypothetical protein